jgi:hypothetical protein
MKVVNLNFDPDGTVKFIHDDEIAALVHSLEPFDMNTKRASHVEPLPGGEGWTVDMSPVGGGLYGPFDTRKFALYFEVEWLKANRGL